MRVGAHLLRGEGAKEGRKEQACAGFLAACWGCERVAGVDSRRAASRAVEEKRRTPGEGDLTARRELLPVARRGKDTGVAEARPGNRIDSLLRARVTFLHRLAVLAS